MTTKLKILLDEALPDDLAGEIEKCSGIQSLRYVRTMPGFRGIKDEPLMAYAKDEKRIVVTLDTGINENSHPPCTHPGVIRLASRRKHEAFTARVFQDFLLSGHRKHAKNAVTYLSEGQARVIGHDGEQTVTF